MPTLGELGQTTMTTGSLQLPSLTTMLTLVATLVVINILFIEWYPQLILFCFQGPGGWNDADFIYTDGEGCSDDKPLEHCPGQTDTEYITEFIMWCMMGSPLIVATDIRNMTDIMKKVCC